MSVHPHRSAETYFIFCVGQNIQTINAFVCAMAHANIPVKRLLGMYKGQSEQSFIARMSDYTPISAWLDDEESILHIHSFNSRDIPQATLLYLKRGEKVPLGMMYPVSKEIALSKDSWTYDPTYNAYFITEK